MNPVGNILFYQSKKTPEQLNPDMPFILGTRQVGANEKFWFQDMRLGINKLKGLLKTALINAGVDISGQKITLKSAQKARIKKIQNSK